MGWYYTHGQSRKLLITELTASGTNTNGVIRNCLAHASVGYNILWTVWEITTAGGAKHRYIGCDLLHRSGDGWGYKPMDESVGPCYWTCPLKYLAMVPVVNAEWRAGVVDYWKKRAARRNVKRGNVLSVQA